MRSEDIRKAIMRGKNGDTEERLLELEELLKQKVEQAVKELETKIDEMLGDTMFRDLEPAKKLAEKVAKEEITSFKEEIKDTAKSILAKLETSAESIMAEGETRIERGVKEMTDEITLKTREVEQEVESSIKNAIASLEAKQEAIRVNVEAYRGPKGDKGEDGKDGVGIPGRDGKDGSPDTPDQVVDKVNKADKKVSLSSIEGLLQEIQNIKQEVRRKQSGSGGGGMGNIMAEVPSGTVNGVNTSFLLTHVPKSNSLILLMNGQFQRNGASYEYTLSGKTITMLAAPMTNEQIFAYYIRT